ncbi:MAG TPA: hypothetical protein VIP46_17530, partial [Pyrinomonadaceae bacterium]
MKDIERRKYEMFLRVREFGAGRAAAFPENSLGRELLNRLDAVVTEIDEHSSAQSSRRGAAQEGAAGKAAARDELRRDLEAISRTARVMALTTPGLENKFRAPRSVSDQALLSTARAFAVDALPLKSEFTRRGLPEDFLEDLADDIEAFAQAITQTIREREAQVSATAAIDGSIERGTNAVSELDVIVRNKFAADPAALAAWLSASHTQRPP